MAAPIKPVRGKPGVFQVSGTNKVLRLVEWREDNVYDTVNVQSGTTSTTAGTELEFFDSLASKKKRDTNLTKQHALPAGWELIVMKLGVYAHITTGNTECTGADLKKIYENAALSAQINDTVIADGWALGYQVGIGMYGSDGASGAAVIAPGTPSIGAAPTLLVPQEINDGHDIRAKLRFDGFGWATSTFAAPSLSVGTTVKFVFRGYLKRPLSKG